LHYFYIQRAMRAPDCGSVWAVFKVVTASLLGSIIPRVENPLPDTIGLELPFATAAAGGVLATVLFANAPQSRRDWQVRRLGLLGFYLGVVVYVITLAVQVGFR
jgi:hypothetical protein